MEEAPAEKPLLDALREGVVWLANQNPAANAAATAADVLPLPSDETLRLRGEIARRDSQIADLAAELAAMKGSRTWRLRRRLGRLPWLHRRAG